MKRILASAAIFALPAAGLAQTVTGVRAELSPAKVGEPVTITVSFEVEQAINSGLRLR